MASALARLFGGGKGKEDQPSPQVAIQKLRETEEMLGKISEFLEKKIAKELAAAKQACMKNKRVNGQGGVPGGRLVGDIYMRRRAAEPRGLTTARTRVVCSLSLVCSVVCGSITESFTAEQREYLERRFTQLTAAMVRPTTTDQVLASGVLLTAQLMAITATVRLTIGSASADDRPVTAGFRAGEYGTDPRRGYGTRGVGWLPSPWRHAWASDAADSANRSILKHFGRRPPVSDILVWAECFTAMAAVLSWKYLQKAPELFAYAHRIFHAARIYDCHAWVTYDRVYRRQAATRCSLNWSVEDQSLYNEAFAGRAKQSTRCSSAWARTIRLRHARRCLWCSYLYRWGRLRPYGKPSVTKFEDDLWDCLRTSWNLISLSVYFRTS
eukprot:Em0018g217a